LKCGEHCCFFDNGLADPDFHAGHKWTEIRSAYPANSGTSGERIGPMGVRQPLSIFATFAKDFTDANVEFAKSGLFELGLDRLYVMQSLPPKLSVALPQDADQE